MVKLEDESVTLKVGRNQPHCHCRAHGVAGLERREAAEESGRGGCYVYGQNQVSLQTGAMIKGRHLI